MIIYRIEDKNKSAFIEKVNDSQFNIDTMSSNWIMDTSYRMNINEANQVVIDFIYN